MVCLCNLADLLGVWVGIGLIVGVLLVWRGILVVVAVLLGCSLVLLLPACDTLPLSALWSVACLRFCVMSELGCLVALGSASKVVKCASLRSSSSGVLAWCAVVRSCCAFAIASAESFAAP